MITKSELINYFLERVPPLFIEIRLKNLIKSMDASLVCNKEHINRADLNHLTEMIT